MEPVSHGLILDRLRQSSVSIIETRLCGWAIRSRRRGWRPAPRAGAQGMQVGATLQHVVATPGA
jgi:hypothetical protein